MKTIRTTLPMISVAVAATLLLTACGGGGGSGGTVSAANYAVGGTLTGLSTSSTITLQLNGGSNLSLDSTANGKSYAFTTQLPQGSTYAVTLVAQPTLDYCTIANANGTVSGSTTNVDVTCVPKWKSVSSKGDTTLGLKSDGTLWAWGLNDYGQLGVGSTPTNNTHCDPASYANYCNVPMQVGTDTKWSALAAGGYYQGYSLALKSDGTLWAWGHNNHGQLGVGGTADSNTPTPVGTDTTWVAVSAGDTHTLALKSAGSCLYNTFTHTLSCPRTLWAWGANGGGELGLPGVNCVSPGGTDQTTPQQVGTDTNWIAVAAGSGFSLALKSDGTLWAWGSNSDGQLGQGASYSSTCSSTPIQVGTDTNWTNIAAGFNFVLAQKSDGTLWSWGNNQSGELGLSDSITAYYSTPTKVGTDIDWTAVGTGFNQGMALKSNGTLWGWGYLYANAPTALDTLLPGTTNSNWSGLAVSYEYTLALKSDGTLWAWNSVSGRNYYGQLGLGDTNDHFSPTQLK